MSDHTAEKAYLRDPDAGPGKLRLLGRFGMGVAAFFLTAIVAGTAGHFVEKDLREAVTRCTWLLLSLWAYKLIGRTVDKQAEPLAELGLVKRATALQEWALGAALGWGLLVVAVLPMALCGMMMPEFWLSGRAWWLFALNLVTLAAGALVEELGFRGYPFQRLMDAVGPVWATVILSVIFGLVHLHNPDATAASTLCTILAGVLLTVAYLRTRALWLCWGLHFAWNLTQGALLGLPVSGTTMFSTVVQTRTSGPIWLTGGAYGPEASYWTLAVLLAGIVVLVKVTEDYAWEYGHKPIVAGGYPMDAPPPPEHEAMEQAAKPKPLVQIAPAQGPGVNPPGRVE